jgi:hypothetical protein
VDVTLDYEAYEMKTDPSCGTWGGGAIVNILLHQCLVKFEIIRQDLGIFITEEKV